MYRFTFAKTVGLGSTSRFTPGLGACMEKTNEYTNEYYAKLEVWTTYQKWLRDYPPGDRRHDDAAAEIDALENRLGELRQLCGFTDETESITVASVKDTLEWNGNSLSKTTQNFLDIMLRDPHYGNIKFNLMTNNAEVWEPDANGKSVPKPWEDCYEAASRTYIEKHYGLYMVQKHTDALRLLFKQRAYNPIIKRLDLVTWDGTERCEHFLTKWGNVEDSAYTREVSRLIFAGGIWRLYQPGCKFDDVPILIGTKQGEGKSSLIRFLAMDDAYYGECNQFDGNQAIEQLSGKWICEISELLALTKTKEVEASKAYITRTVDQYRKPWDRNVSELPRRCIFIGTTNNANPLRDKTGNRRFYPVTVHSDGYELYKHEAECREYIEQCWAEARDKYKAGKMQNYAKRELIEEYRAAQEDAMQDDWRVGAIEQYLSKKSVGDHVCVRELSNEALSHDGIPRDPSFVESKDIAMIMQRFGDWEKAKQYAFPKYGKQRSWVKVSGEPQEELPF